MDSTSPVFHFHINVPVVHDHEKQSSSSTTHSVVTPSSQFSYGGSKHLTTPADPSRSEKLDQAYRLLQGAKQKRVVPAAGDWILRSDLEAVWNKIDTKQFFNSLGLHMSSAVNDLIYREYLYLISILSTIQWNRWAEFRSMSVHHEAGSFKDENFPINDKDSLLAYMTERQADEFLRYQFDYAHIILRGHGVAHYSALQVLPFLLAGHERISTGASGTVYKDIIPPHCLLNRNGESNSKQIKVARKVIEDDTRDNEEYGARLLQESITKHERVLETYCVYRIEESLHILSPLADDDLENFMTNEKYDHVWHKNSCFKHLLSEISHLASGLAFLHDKVRDPETSDHIMCHMDFRPQNILVFMEPSSYFQFKISDFGITKSRKKSVSGSLLERRHILSNRPLEAPREDTKTIPKRGRGTHQAPEMHYAGRNQVGRKSDVWSLACIIVRLLTRALFGRQALDRFDDERISTDPKKENDFFYCESEVSGKWKLTGAVEIWLQNLSKVDEMATEKFSPCRDIQIQKQLGDGFQHLSRALRKALEVNEEKRCTADNVKDSLDEICGNVGPALDLVSLNFMNCDEEKSTSLERVVPGSYLSAEPSTILPSTRVEVEIFLRQYRQSKSIQSLQKNVSFIQTSREVESKVAKWLRDPSCVALSLVHEKTTMVTKCIYHLARVSSADYVVLTYIVSSETSQGDHAFTPMRFIHCLLDQLIESVDLEYPSTQDWLRTAVQTEDLSISLSILKNMLSSKRGCVLILDDFAKMQGDSAASEFWKSVFEIFGCSAKQSTALMIPLKVFIRSSSSFANLQRFGYGGKWVSNISQQMEKYLVLPRFERLFTEAFSVSFKARA